MKHRKLRIAWLVGWGLVAVLLCVLWMRSYWWNDTVHCPFGSSSMLLVNSGCGRINVYAGTPPILQFGEFPSGWGTYSDAIILRSGAPPEPFWAYMNLGYARSLRFPLWLPILLLVALAAISAKLRLPFRFSLRTLLIATTLVAVVLGLIVWLSRAV